jgi:hypothetical protein
MAADFIVPPRSDFSWGKEPVDFVLEEDDINSNPFSTGLPEGK